MHRNRTMLIAVLIFAAAVTDAQTPAFSPGSRSATGPRAATSEDPTAYGLAAGNGIAYAQVVLARRRNAGDPKDIVGSAGEIVAKAVSGVGGGVTFENVPPGQYVMTITVPHIVAPPTTSTDEIRLPPDLFFASRRVKSFAVSRSEVVPMTIAGQPWRSFARVPYVYAVRAASLTNEAAEARTDPYSTVIAQQFVVSDGNPTAVVAAVGHGC